jgi:hypothetical protein
VSWLGQEQFIVSNYEKQTNQFNAIHLFSSFQSEQKLFVITVQRVVDTVRVVRMYADGAERQESSVVTLVPLEGYFTTCPFGITSPITNTLFTP